ncbi:MAG TPA: hypothetical protein VK034_10910 [Enhygromyxa sp.]|nr:hypothetical protein [Enhygromyxa sp.]
MLRVIYELTDIAALGDNTGNDWTFYVHTGAGLVCFNASTDADDDRRPRVIGVRTRPAASTDRAEFERELWWASATEHDLAVPEHGAGLFTPVWIPLEPGLEIHRSLHFDVAEARRWAKHDRVAHLRLDVRARVERSSDAPAPTVDATLLIPDATVPRPELTAGELPDHFTAELEGVDIDDLPVVGERILLLGRDYTNGDPRADALANFLTHFAGGFMPAWYQPRAALYQLRNVDGQPFWIGRNSSMGQRNNRRIIEAFAELAPPLGNPVASELGGFEELRSLLVELLGSAHTVELAPSAEALARLIAALVTQFPERATVEREVYVRTALIDEISGEWTRAFIVDPTPFSGPDEYAWMVVWTDSWTE